MLKSTNNLQHFHSAMDVWKVMDKGQLCAMQIIFLMHPS